MNAARPRDDGAAAVSRPKVADTLTSPMPPMPRRNLILAAAVGYRWPQIAPFVLSLRATGCRAQVVLLVGPMDAETRQALAAHAITALPVHRLVTRLPPHLARKRFNRYWLGWLHRTLPRTIGHSPSPASPRNALLARAASWFHHPACSRYFAYYRFLRRRVNDYADVLTSDVRDVIFQRDPFAAPCTQGSVFLEHAARHGSEEGNDRWIETGFGAEGLAALRGKRVTCSGLTLAPSQLMLRYLSAMTRELALRTARLTGYDGVDQGVHNWLYWNERLPGFDAVENFAGPVLTMHGLPASALTTNSQGEIVDREARAIPVLHQYDRHPAFAAPLLERIQRRAGEPSGSKA